MCAGFWPTIQRFVLSSVELSTYGRLCHNFEGSLFSLQVWNRVGLMYDPPLARVIESGISRSIIDRMESSATKGVPKVWRGCGNALGVEVFAKDGHYAKSNRSPTVAKILLSELVDLLQQCGATGETRIVRSSVRFEGGFRQLRGCLRVTSRGVVTDALTSSESFRRLASD